MDEFVTPTRHPAQPQRPRHRDLLEPRGEHVGPQRHPPTVLPTPRDDFRQRGQLVEIALPGRDPLHLAPQLRPQLLQLRHPLGRRRLRGHRRGQRALRLGEPLLERGQIPRHLFGHRPNRRLGQHRLRMRPSPIRRGQLGLDLRQPLRGTRHRGDDLRVGGEQGDVVAGRRRFRLGLRLVLDGVLVEQIEKRRHIGFEPNDTRGPPLRFTRFVTRGRASGSRLSVNGVSPDNGIRPVGSGSGSSGVGGTGSDGVGSSGVGVGSSSSVGGTGGTT
ncbi:hypothetical protein NCAST_23_01520, partial [Nocardia asteroides NBRC 15531]